MIETFFDNLMAGNIRAIVTLILGSFVLFVALKHIRRAMRHMRPYLNVVVWILIILLVYGWFVFPAKVTLVFATIVNFITGFIESIPLKG